MLPNHPELATLIFIADNLQTALATFVSFPSVSGSNSTMEDCRQAAIWLKQCLSQVGASRSAGGKIDNAYAHR
jgi:acetylornithine deacetylase/succinyl-diaminopimelate desuccinylase-like protein